MFIDNRAVGRGREDADVALPLAVFAFGAEVGSGVLLFGLYLGAAVDLDGFGEGLAAGGAVDSEVPGGFSGRKDTLNVLSASHQHEVEYRHI